MATTGGGGGYPPMATLEGAVPGWPEGRPLTAAVTPEAARAVLQAESATSVLHPAGLLWGLVRRVGLVVFLMVWLGFAVTMVSGLVSGDRERMPAALMLLGFIALLVGRALPWGWQRVAPAAGSLPSTRRERLNLNLAAIRGEVTTAPAATWPAGSEAFALLSATAKSDGIDAPWLFDRAGLPEGVGSQWLAYLDLCGFLTGGGAPLGRWLREPVKITDAGRTHLEAERERLRVLDRLGNHPRVG